MTTHGMLDRKASPLRNHVSVLLTSGELHQNHKVNCTRYSNRINFFIVSIIWWHIKVIGRANDRLWMDSDQRSWSIGVISAIATMAGFGQPQWWRKRSWPRKYNWAAFMNKAVKKPRGCCYFAFETFVVFWWLSFPRILANVWSYMLRVIHIIQNW